MSNLKINENVFIGKQELNRIVKFLGEDGYKEFFQNNMETFGIMRLEYEDGAMNGQPFSEFKVEIGSSPDLITIKAGKAVNENFDLINIETDLIDVMTQPTDNVQRFVWIQYNTTNDEVGTVDISNTGQVSGTNTLFTQCLRGQPNFPVKIKFPNSVLNTLEYEVVQVSSDTQAQIQGLTTVETNQEYVVVGTFTPNASIPPANKDIYVFDHYTIGIDIPANLPVTPYISLGLINTDGISSSILDTRYQFYTTKASYEQNNFQVINAPLCGLEQLEYDTIYSDGSSQLATFGWGFRSEAGDWAGDLETSTIVINAGRGGIYQDVTQPPNGLFVGSRIYFSGQVEKSYMYHNIISMTQNGASITIVLDQYSAGTPISGEQISIVPDADKIVFQTNYFSAGVEPNVAREQMFAIQDGVGTMEVKFPSTMPHSLKAEYKLTWNKWQSKYHPINDGQYMDESSFDDKGVITVPNYANVNAGVFSLIPDANSDFLQHAKLNEPNVFTSSNQFSYATVDLSDPAVYDPAFNLLTLPNTANTFMLNNASVLASAPTQINEIQGVGEVGVGGIEINLFTTNGYIQYNCGNPTGGGGYYVGSADQYKYGDNPSTTNSRLWVNYLTDIPITSNGTIVLGGYESIKLCRIFDSPPPAMWKILSINRNSEGEQLKFHDVSQQTSLYAYTDNGVSPAGGSGAGQQATFNSGLPLCGYKIIGDMMYIQFEARYTNTGGGGTWNTFSMRGGFPVNVLPQSSSLGGVFNGYGYAFMYHGGGSAISDNHIYVYARQSPASVEIELMFRQLGASHTATGSNPNLGNMPYQGSLTPRTESVALVSCKYGNRCYSN